MKRLPRIPHSLGAGHRAFRTRRAAAPQGLSTTAVRRLRDAIFDAPSPATSTREAALAEIGALPLTEAEWVVAMGFAIMLRLGGISIEGLRVLASQTEQGESGPRRSRQQSLTGESAES